MVIPNDFPEREKL